MKIIYKGKLNTKLDKKIEEVLKEFNYTFSSSGYEYQTQERDLNFDIKSVKQK